MKGVAIYVEGGGDRGGKDSIRKGIDSFLRSLKALWRERRLGWRIIACGSRNRTFDAFTDGLKNDPDTLNVLLVDSEGKVDAKPMDHLTRQDGWSFSNVDGDAVHLMVRTMETWIVSDKQAVARFYGQGFNSSQLPPDTGDLESVDKETILRALNAATSQTKTKRTYHKIHHAAVLLEKIDPAIVRRRCKHCDNLFVYLQAKIGSS